LTHILDFEPHAGPGAFQEHRSRPYGAAAQLDQCQRHHAAGRRRRLPWQLGIPDNAIVALYSGNMGGKQGLQILADLARRLNREDLLWFLFREQGPERAALEEKCQGLTRVIFLDLRPAESLGALLGTADIHLLPQRAGAADLLMPSKLTGMLSSGRPVFYGAARGTELSSVVSRCGLLTSPEDAVAMAKAVRKLSYNAQIHETLGAAARQYAMAHLRSCLA